MSKRTRGNTKRTREMGFLQHALESNAHAFTEGPKRKTWSLKDLKTIKPKNNAQEELFHAWYNGKHLVAHGSAGTGKAQPLHSKVLTPSGWKRMGDIKIGELVLTPTGKQSQVIGVFPQGKMDIYTITFSDGATAQCCLEHLWECYIPKNFHNSKSIKQIVDTKTLITWLNEKKARKSRANISIDLITNPIQYNEKSFDLDPYVLGVLIGDGCVTTNTPHITTADSFIAKKVNALLDEGYKLSKIPSAMYEYSICQKNPINYGGSIGMSKNQYTDHLKTLKLHNKKSYEKFIPPIYKNGSIQQRLSLIQGLFDTDGTIGKSGDVSYSTSSFNLARDIQEVLWSLGAKCSITKKFPFYVYEGTRKSGRINYTLQVSYRTRKDLFSLPSKINKCKNDYDLKQLKRQIDTIKLTSYEQAQCIMIDDPSHLYVTDDYVVTHNTFLAFYLALQEVLEQHARRIIIVRSAVATREVGFLPGTLEEKTAMYELPYKDIAWELIGRNSTYDDMKEAGVIEFMTTSFVRGLTWDNAIVLVDEGQNMTFHEINSIMTRIGNNTRIIFTGDTKQTDLDGRKLGVEGMTHALKVFKGMDSFESIEFTKHDIVRSEFCKQWIIACEEKSA